MSYSIDARGSETLDFDSVVEAVDESFATWMEVTCDGQMTDLTVTRTDEFALCREEQFNNEGPNVNTIAFLPTFEGTRHANNALAVTIIWRTDDGEILDVDMLINDSLGPYERCPESGCSGSGIRAPVDLSNIVTHEAGHFFGIAHSDDTEATMYKEAPRGEVSKKTLAQDDINALCAIYPPGSLQGSCDPTPRGGLQLDCSLPQSANSGGGCSAGSGHGPFAWEIALVVLGLLVCRARTRQVSQ